MLLKLYRSPSTAVTPANLKATLHTHPKKTPGLLALTGFSSLPISDSPNSGRDSTSKQTLISTLSAATVGIHYSSWIHFFKAFPVI